MNIEGMNYSLNTSPEGYKCTGCQATNCKMWREYQTFADQTQLLCVMCAQRDQKFPAVFNQDGYRESNWGRCDQLGFLVPAVPTVEGDTFWGYTSVPEDGVNWWRRLPTYPFTPRKDYLND